MRKLVLICVVLFFVSLFSQYSLGETVRSEDNLTWTDSDGHPTTLFDEIFLQKNVVVIYYGGAG